MISFEDWVTASGRFPERLKSPELTATVKNLAVEMLGRVNEALKHLEIASVSVSSGFRPQKVNAAVGGARLSTHTLGMAIDIVDSKDHRIAKLFTREILEKFDLYREDYDFTKGKWSNWVHLDTRKRVSRIFKP